MRLASAFALLPLVGLTGLVGLIGLVGGCHQSTAQQCMTMGGRSDLVTNAALFKLDVYPDTVTCDGADVAPGSAPTQSRTFKPGDAIKLDIPPGHQTIVLTTYADEAGTIEMGSGCTTTDLKPGGQVCINLTIMAAPDIAVVNDLSTEDIASCSGPDCPCMTSPDSCPAGEFCGSGQMCQMGCKAGSDCNGMGPATDGGLPRTSCNTTLHQCVECTSNDQCPLGKVCSPSGSCVTGCDASHACPGGATCCNSLCVDTTSDPLNCGTCGNPCTGATNTCCTSSCVDLNANADNCGSCGHACSSAGVAKRQCSTGQCAPICNFGKGDCNGSVVKNPPNDGCETDITTTNNCGGCNVACDTTPAKNASAPTCFNVPDAGAATCKYSCLAPFQNCSNAAPDVNGCETDTSTDKLNCGGCNNACDTLTDNGPTCTNSTCGHSSCKLNQADCNNPNHNQNECETLATDATQACGTDSCTPCSTGGIITTRSCTLNGASSASCSYTCDNTKCPNTNAASHTCDGTRCSYTCSNGFFDCNSSTAPDNDGCECPAAHTSQPLEGTPGCCPNLTNNCQGAHDTGLASGTEKFFNCVAPNTYADTATTTVGSSEAIAACTRHNGGSSATCAEFTCSISNKKTGDELWCDNNGCLDSGGNPINGCTCNCWDWALFGTFPGGAAQAAGHVNTSCNCATTGDPSWH